MGTLYVGTSGFAYKEWKGLFYPQDLSDKQFLTYYSSQLPSVEINYTFRRMPAETTLENWRGQSGEGFQITLKAPQRITHFKRLIDVQEDVDEFVRRAKSLGDRLGAVLFQLPPSFAYERKRLEDFLTILPPVVRYAMEYRHASWKDPGVSELLSASDVAVCWAETEEAALDSVPQTASFAYLRLRKQAYSAEEIAAWAGRLRPLLEEGRDVYCYFKHEGGGEGPVFARALKEAVGG